MGFLRSRKCRTSVEGGCIGNYLKPRLELLTTKEIFYLEIGKIKNSLLGPELSEAKLGSDVIEKKAIKMNLLPPCLL